MKKSIKSSWAVAIIIVVFCGGMLIQPPHNILAWDVFGYYLYLPMTFIYHDLGMRDIQVVYDIINQYQISDCFYQGWMASSGNWIIKYTSGQSILFLPFFLVAHVITLLTGGVADGFSSPYQWGIIIGCCFYMVLSILLLRKILLKFTGETATALTLILVFLGTNYATTFHTGCANIHFQLFFLYTVLLHYTIKWHEKPSLKYMIGIAISAGLLTLSRPTDIICLLIPFLWNINSKKSLTEKIQLIKQYKKQLWIAFAIVMALGSIQLIYWQIYSGRLIMNSYRNYGEGMEYFHPFIWQTLVGFRKGWYLYTPMMLVATLGFISIYRHNKKIFAPLFAFFIMNVYLVSCWSCWWYADSFGQRAYIQSYPIMAIALSILIQSVIDHKKRIIQVLFFTLITVLFLLNLFQTWQFSKGIIHTSRMSKEAYFTNFFATQYNPNSEKIWLINRSFNSFEEKDTLHVYTEKQLHIENKVIKMDSTSEFTPAFKLSYQDITKKNHAWIQVSARIFSTTDLKDNPISLVISFEHKGKSYKYICYDLAQMNLKPGEWNEIKIDYLTPEIRRVQDNLCVYFWHQGKQTVWIDDFTINSFILD
ncbi:MAG: hypothetical protein RR356_01040 [Bacteroidales bacterium]